MSKIIDVVILTEAQYINPTKTNWYVDQVLLEDKLVQEALERKGLTVVKKDWADASFDWTTAKTLLFRTIWDYFHRFAEFSTWLDHVSKICTLINPAEQIRWNIDKHYLADLEKAGVNCVDTVFIPRGEKPDLAKRLARLGWKKAVIKPTVSGTARHTYLLNEKNLDEHEELIAPVLKNEDFMLQPFQENILKHGEVSHVVINGTYSHSILKLAKAGDFRVQDDFGGTIDLYAPSTAEVELAEKASAACKPLPIYARVDVVIDNDNQLAVGEVELIEPELWFRKNDKAADKLADAIVQRYF